MINTRMPKSIPTMAMRTTEFLTDWLRWHVVGRIAGADDIPELANKCINCARRQGISRADLENAVGSVEECIRQSLVKPE